MRGLFVLLLLCGLGGAVFADTPNLEPGVPRGLAAWRKERYRAVRYALRLVLRPNAEALTGELKISVTLDGEPQPIILDWRTNTRPGEQPARVSGWRVNGQETDKVSEQNEHLIVPQELTKTGENEIRVQFSSPVGASGRAVTRYRDREDGSEYLYTLFVPSDASAVFPCFDQPDLKARFTLETLVPDGWRVVTNTEAAEVAPSANDKLYRARFRETEPISTYLFAFAAGPFAEINEEFVVPPAGGSDESRLQAGLQTPMRIFVRKSRLERARKEAAEVFRLNRAALGYFHSYFGQPFPFPKYDLVIVPEFAYGGMEHAGATFLREEAILFPTEPTANDLFDRLQLMFHEAAHQWFGDLVTMRWFDDLWLKEGFATFMAYKAAEATQPQFNAWKIFYQRTKPLAYLTDATQGTTPIYQEIANLSAAKSAYGNIVYRKAPSFLRQAEFYLGPDKFQTAIQSFLKAHAYDNAEWRDLVANFEQASGQKLDAWAEAWVKRRGVPVVRVKFSDQRIYQKLGRPHDTRRIVSLQQQDALGEGGLWPLGLKVLLVYDNGIEEVLPVTMNQAETTVKIYTVLIASNPRATFPAPRYIFANAGDYGYGLFPLDERSREFVLKNLGDVKDDFLRAQLWGSLWDSVRDAELAPADYLELALQNLTKETDDVTVQTIAGRAQTAFNRYLSDEQQKAFAPRLEKLLAERMMNAETIGLRITYWRAFQSVASTDEGRATLKKMLRGETAIPGLTLRSRDKFDLITILTARGDADAPALLEAQTKADPSDDGRRYAYAAAAARPDAAVKEKYFTAYLNDKELPESWIEASFGPFNNPRQAALTLPYLEPALKSLPQHKRARKIFFVNGWLAAFIGGQCSAEAKDAVQNFLEQEKTLDRDLRLKVLEGADGLNRCVNIRAKYAVAPAPATKPSRPKRKNRS